MRQTPILIIGAGPTGLILSLELHLHKIPHLLVDSLITPSQTSRALVLHPRTLELLSRHDGLVETLISKGKLNMGMRMWVNGKFIFELDVGDVGGRDSRFSGPLMISQAEIEGVLEGRLREMGGGVERGIKAENLVQDESCVVATLKSEDRKEEEVRCQYVVGCDGAHSIVRKSAGLRFEGAAYAQDFILADLHMKWEYRDCINVFMGGYGFMATFPMKDGVWRVLCSRVNERDSDVEPKLRDFEESFKQLVVGKVELSSPVWISRFRLHHRIVENYRVGRLFLAGDAAHIHSPAGGQGMNTGMQDSVNLAWKFAAVLNGAKEDSFLDTYNLERRKIGENLLKGTDRAFEFMATRNWFLLWLRNWLVPWVVPWVMRNRETRVSRFRFVSMLGIRYRNSCIVGQAKSWNSWVIRGGDRAPDGKLIGVNEETWLHVLIREPKNHLLLFSGIGDGAMDGATLEGAASDFVNDGNGSVKIHKILKRSSTLGTEYLDRGGVVHRLFGFKDSGYVLVRPDGHVSFIGPLAAMDELKVWMKK